MRRTTVFDIRELLRYLQQGESQEAIHQALGVSRRTVRKYQRWARQHGLLSDPLPTAAELEEKLRATQPPAPPQSTSTVERHREKVIDLRQRGLECQAIYQRLRDEQGYGGSYSSVWRFVREMEGPAPDTTVRVEVAPGEEAQVDFGYAGKMYDPEQKKVRKAWMFVMTLSHSRHQYVEFIFDQTITTWLEAHRRALEFFGGVPKRIKLDNLKAAILKASVDDPQVQRTYRECAEHYGFLISPCRVATPQHKGKVENGVRYVKRNFLAGHDFTAPQHHIRHANQEVLAWVCEVAGQRKHGTTKQQPLVCFLGVEREALRPLPSQPFQLVAWKEVKLHRDCYVVVAGAYYSAPYRLVGQTLTLRTTPKSVEIYTGSERVAIHSRVSAGQRQTLLAHLPPQKVAGLTLSPSACLDRAAAIGVHTLEVVTQLLQERPVDRLRAVHRLLTYAEREDNRQRLEQTCARALELEDLSPRTLWSLLHSNTLTGQDAQAIPTWPRFARRPEELTPVQRQG